MQLEGEPIRMRSVFTSWASGPIIEEFERNTRLCRDTRGRHGSVREELAAGVDAARQSVSSDKNVTTRRGSPGP
jgi:hypothetical protein